MLLEDLRLGKKTYCEPGSGPAGVKPKFYTMGKASSKSLFVRPGRFKS